MWRVNNSVWVFARPVPKTERGVNRLIQDLKHHIVIVGNHIKRYIRSMQKDERDQWRT